MTWIIAILLGLILVALVSSNEKAAEGVWKVIRFVLVGIVLLIAWGVLIGFNWWFSTNYYKSEWEMTLNMCLSVFLPPVALWFARKNLIDNFKRDKKSAFKQYAKYVLFTATFMLVLVIFMEVKTSHEYGGWFMILTPLAFTSIVLFLRTLHSPKNWRDVWFGRSLPDIDQILDKEREAEFVIDEAEWKKFAATCNDQRSLEQYAMEDKWADGKSEQHYQFDCDREERWANFEKRMDALVQELLAKRAAIENGERWTVNGFFWMFFTFAIFGLIGIAWDFGFAYVMGLEFIHERTWLAAVVVIGAGLLILGLLISIYEYIKESKALERGNTADSA